MSVNYTYISPDGPESDTHFNDAACFSSLNYLSVDVMPKVIKYEAVARLPDTIAFWLEFIGEWLDEDRFIAIPDETDAGRVDFWLDCAGLSNKQALLYLTAFRYIHEFSDCVRKLHDYHKLMGAAPNELFVLMCEMHGRGEEGGYGSGHSLASVYSGYTPGYLTIDEFTDRLEEKNDRVHQYFRKSDKPKPSILDQVVGPCF